MNHKIISYTIGWVLNIEAACMLLPLICALVYNENVAFVFIWCMALCLLPGFLLVRKSPESKTMFAKEGFLTVALSWIVMSLFGSLPFIFSGEIPNFADALFETVSGFTTTGASILSNVEALPKSLIFWRSFTHWIGGMGVLVFLVALLPLSGGGNIYLLKAESTGPSVGKLVPKVKSTAKILYGIYLGITVTQVVLLLFGGLNLFEALTTTFGTVGTGGFGIKNTSMADFSPYVQNVVTVFMILCGVDFSVYYLLFLFKFKTAIRSDEVKAYFGIILTSIIIITINCRSYFESFADTLRHAAFQVGSVITTTGFGTTDFDKWPELSKMILLFLMFVGACAGSTGGGIKVSRIIILLKSIVKEVRIAVHPRMTIKSTMNGRLIEHETVRAVNVFMVSYFVIFAVSMFLISIDNFNFTTNFTAVLATLNNIGPGFDLVGPTQNFSIFSDFSKIVLTIAMLIGRLEIFPILVLLSPYTWKK